jgi:hypothetical protein
MVTMGNSSTNIITCGEDAYIKIWDPSMTMIQKVDLRVINPLPDLNNPVSLNTIIFLESIRDSKC